MSHTYLENRKIETTTTDTFVKNRLYNHVNVVGYVALAGIVSNGDAGIMAITAKTCYDLAQSMEPFGTYVFPRKKSNK